MSGIRRRAARDVPLRLVLAALLAITLLALLGLVFTPSDPSVRIGHVLQPPGWLIPLGTDDIGRDLFSRVLAGVSLIWLPSLAVVLAAASFGSLIGAVAGAAGGWVDLLLRRLITVFRAFPAPVMAMATAAALGPSLLNVTAALAMFWWPWYARLVRTKIRAVRLRPYADAARLAGVSPVAQLTRYLLPAALPSITVNAALDVGNVVVLFALLSFLGLGDDAAAPQLGAMTARSLALLPDVWRVPVAPAAAVFAMALAANTAGEVLRRRLPRG
jgi:peptide/nickel transport system permease protein